VFSNDDPLLRNLESYHNPRPPVHVQVQSNLQQQAQLQHQHQQLQHQQAHLAMMAHHQQGGGVAHNPLPMTMEAASPLSQHASRPTTPGDLARTTSQSMLPQQQGLPGSQVPFSTRQLVSGLSNGEATYLSSLRQRRTKSLTKPAQSQLREQIRLQIHIQEPVRSPS